MAEDETGGGFSNANRPGEYDDSELSSVHQRIDACTVCAAAVGQGYRKPIGLIRGGRKRVMIIGQGPGRSEMTHRRAFAGMSGRRLDSWLLACGAPAHDPRSTVYTTSVIKCVCPDSRFFTTMAMRCMRFLDEQVATVRPELVITLGEHAFDSIGIPAMGYETSLCRLVRTEDHLLLTRFGRHFAFMPWPHPSGLNRWHNNSANRLRLEYSFESIRPFFTKERTG